MMRKRITLWMLALSLLVTGCAGITDKSETTAPDTEEPVVGYDAQNKYRGVVPGALAFQETEDAFCGAGFLGDTLYYYDKNAGVSGVLCADPSCAHDSSECGAKLDMGGFFYAGDGKAYWIQKGSMDNGWDRTLYKGDLFGTNREKVKVISTQDVIYKYNPQWFVIHRGRLYLQGQKDVVEGVNTFKRITLVSSTLDSSEEYTVLFDEKFDQAVHPFVRFVGDYLYLTLQIFPEGGPFDVRILKIHTKTGKTETVYEELEMAGYIDPPWVTNQGEIYLPGGGDQACVWKLDNGKRVEIASFPDSTSPPYIFDGIAAQVDRIDGVRYIHIVNLEGETVYEGEMFPEGLPGMDADPNAGGISIIGGDSEKLIVNLMHWAEEGGTTGSSTVMLDLHDNLKATVLWSEQG